MSKEVIAKAGKIIGDMAGKMEAGFATIALIDEQGYPTASTVTIAKADGISTLAFCVSLDDNKARRVAGCNKASVCINAFEYNITLVGTAEIHTDPESKKDAWLPGCGEIWAGGVDDPDFCVLRFTTQRYNLYLDEQMAAGNL